MSKITKGLITDKINGITVNTSIKCNSGNYTNMASSDKQYVVIHYTANKKDTAKNNAIYFRDNVTKSSAQLFVDETTIYQSVELRDKAWHVGCSQGYKTACRNENSIGIEMCTSGDYLVSEKTQINAAYTCAYLCKLIGITDSQVDTYVLRHYDVVKSNKPCPAQFVSHPTEWTAFKKMVKNILKTGNYKGEVKTTTITDKKLVAAASKSSTYNKTYTTTDAAALRYGAGIIYGSILTIPKGAKVSCYGYYTKNSAGNVWLYVVYNGKEGYVTSSKLK